MDNNKDNSALAGLTISETDSRCVAEAHGVSIETVKAIFREHADFAQTYLAAQAEQSQPPVPRVGGITLAKQFGYPEILPESAVEQPTGDLPTISRSMYGSLEECEREQARRDAAHLASQSQAAQPSIDEKQLRQLVLDVSNFAFFCGNTSEDDPTYGDKMEAAKKADEALISYVLAGTSQATKAQAEPEGWLKFTEDSQINFGQLVDVVLTNGVYEFSRLVNQVDWTQVSDWRYAAPVAKEAQPNHALMALIDLYSLIAHGWNVPDESYHFIMNAACVIEEELGTAPAPVTSVAKEAEKEQQAAPEVPLWDDNGEPWNEAAEKAEQQAHVMPPMRGTDSQLDEGIAGAVARGWCAPENGYKVMDSVLAFAIIREVEKEFARRFRAQGGNTNTESSDAAPTTSTVSAPGVQATSMLSGALNHARDALRFYAEKEHFILAEPDAWDTVSGEPQNFQCDEAGTATVEDGTVAKQALESIAGVEAYSSSTEGTQAAPEDVRNQALEEAAKIVDGNGIFMNTGNAVRAKECARKIRALKRTSTDQANADTGSAA